MFKPHDDDEVLNEAIFVNEPRITLCISCISEINFRQDLEVRARIHEVVNVGPEVLMQPVVDEAKVRIRLSVMALWRGRMHGVVIVAGGHFMGREKVSMRLS